MTIQTERETFLAERRKGIGGSDIAALVGLDPRKTRYQLWREKVGLPLPDGGKPAARRRGNFLELAVVRRYAELIQPAAIETTIAHEADGGWRRGNQDARATMPDGTRRCVEVKTVTRHVHRSDWGAPWSDEVPDRALAQGLWYGALDNAHIVDFAVLVVPDDPDEVIGLTADEVVAAGTLHVYQAARNREVEAFLVEHARRFWTEHVLTGLAPDPSVDDVEIAWPAHSAGKSRDATPILGMLREYDELGRVEKDATDRRRHLRAEILLYAQDCEALTIGPNPVLTTKLQERTGYHVAPSSARVVRFTKHWKPIPPNMEN